MYCSPIYMCVCLFLDYQNGVLWSVFYRHVWVTKWMYKCTHLKRTRSSIRSLLTLCFKTYFVKGTVKLKTTGLEGSEISCDAGLTWGPPVVHHWSGLGRILSPYFGPTFLEVGRKGKWSFYLGWHSIVMLSVWKALVFSRPCKSHHTDVWKGTR